MIVERSYCMKLEEKEAPEGGRAYYLWDEHTYTYEDGRTIIDTVWFPLEESLKQKIVREHDLGKALTLISFAESLFQTVSGSPVRLLHAREGDRPLEDYSWKQTPEKVITQRWVNGSWQHYQEGEIPALSDQEAHAYRHTWDGQRSFYYHSICVERNPPGPDVTFERIALADVPPGAECDFCYRRVHSSEVER